MADVLSVGVNLEAFAQAISAIQALRSSVSRVFDCLKDGMRNKETLEGREKAFIAHFQDNLHSVNRDLNELERLSNLVGKPSENHPLHNSGLLSLDPVQDKTPLYSQLLQAYKWSNKLQYHAGLASGLLNQQSLKRSANQMGVSAKRRPKAQPTTLVLPPQYVDDVISRIDRMFPEMSIHLSRPNGTSAMLLVTLGKVLKVIVVMRSLFIDRTIVRGYSENVYTEDGKLDIWSKSNYQVFQKVTDHATTALLHYQLPQMPDVVVRSFMKSASAASQDPPPPQGLVPRHTSTQICHVTSIWPAQGHRPARLDPAWQNWQLWVSASCGHGSRSPLGRLHLARRLKLPFQFTLGRLPVRDLLGRPTC
ncbi:mediator of RNA polymerase II transcription subunit 27 isoform X1 [Ursus americanus]|uniref:mediator of RNA polymerase II transcription subunit 27 isoform X1 n=1 Tax=Ursus americanus TaxID=9643 RepID=UPI001E67AE6A|nr:mediator of RNA polymerase II transcription subunit 27 isoform X1 [Ursus americanus]